MAQPLTREEYEWLKENDFRSWGATYRLAATIDQLWDEIEKLRNPALFEP